MNNTAVWLLILLFPLAGCISSFDREWPGDDDSAEGDDDAADDDGADDDVADDDAADDDAADDDTAAGAPDISTTPAGVNIDPAPMGVPTTGDILVRNDGDQPLAITAMPETVDGNNMMTVHEWTGTIPPGGNQPMEPMVTVTCPKALGTVNNEFSIISNDPDEGVLAIPVTINCTAAAR